MNKKQITRQIGLGVVAVAVTFGSWSCKPNTQTTQTAQTQSGGGITQLSKEDVTAILKTLPPQTQQMMASSPEQVGELLKDLKQLLAVAAEARKNNLHNEPEIKSQLEFVASSVIAAAYDREQRGGDPGAQPFANVKPEDIDAFYKEPGAEDKYNEFLALIKKRMSSGPQGAAEIPEPQLKEIRDSYAKLSLTERKAREAGFDKKRETEMQIALQQASFLAQEYAKRTDAQFTVTDAELAEYVQTHPEADPSKKREQAEQILQKAKGGEDFAKLAKEFSEDPGSKQEGGLYKDVKKGQMVPEFETAALALEPGQITQNLVESNYGYHIIKLESKKGETYNVRHILVMTTAPASNPYSKPMNLSDKAREEIKSKKREKWLEEITAKNEIILPNPEEIKIEPPPAPPAPPAMPEQPTKSEPKTDDKNSKK